VTEFAAVAVVPVLPGTADKPAGSQGLYDIAFVLGVPGVSSVTTSLDFDAIAAGGDSLLQGSGLHVQLESSHGQSLHAARIVPNRSGRLAQIRLTVTADDFSSAENEAFDAVMPTLSRIAFQADTPLEVTAISLTERATQTRQLRTTLVGAVQPAPEIAETTTPELRMFLAAYCAGLKGTRRSTRPCRSTRSSKVRPSSTRTECARRRSVANRRRQTRWRGRFRSIPTAWQT